MIDVHLLLKKLRRVEDDLEYLKSVSSQAELMDGMSRSVIDVSEEKSLKEAVKDFFL